MSSTKPQKMKIDQVLEKLDKFEKNLEQTLNQKLEDIETTIMAAQKPGTATSGDSGDDDSGKATVATVREAVEAYFDDKEKEDNKATQATLKKTVREFVKYITETVSAICRISEEELGTQGEGDLIPPGKCL